MKSTIIIGIAVVCVVVVGLGAYFAFNLGASPNQGGYPTGSTTSTSQGGSTTTSSQGTTTPVSGKFPVFCPYEALTLEEIESIGADGFTGSDEEIANAIVAWQDTNMYYTNPMEHQDVSYPMRWNYIMPGIYPVSEMIVERRTGDGKIYGICWDYAAIFSSIAKYYGLETRVTAYKIYMSGSSTGETGMGPDEYDAMVPKLEQNGLDFTYEDIRAAAHETWSHYRAEVKIDGQWTAFDGTHPTGDYILDSNYEEAPWDEGFNSNLGTY
jgi:transglutaminase-like putative cysteine protease